VDTSRVLESCCEAVSRRARRKFAIRRVASKQRVSDDVTRLPDWARYPRRAVDYAVATDTSRLFRHDLPVIGFVLCVCDRARQL